MMSSYFKSISFYIVNKFHYLKKSLITIGDTDVCQIHEETFVV